MAYLYSYDSRRVRCAHTPLTATPRPYASCLTTGNHNHGW